MTAVEVGLLTQLVLAVAAVMSAVLLDGRRAESLGGVDSRRPSVSQES